VEFARVEQRWVQRLGRLRNVVRQELIGRQLAPFVTAGMSVLDVGCERGTQAVRLAAAGARVTGVDPSLPLLDRFRAHAREAGVEVEALAGSVADLDAAVQDRTFDLVCAHGLLMYLDPVVTLAVLARRVSSGGLLSVTFRNAEALAFRPAMRGDWAGALAAFDSSDYVNELGAQARADRLPDVAAVLEAEGLRVLTWFGVRLFTDAVGVDVVPPPDGLDVLLDAEEQAGRLDPYRRLAAQTHVVAQRS
jgi:S-adenosylmethionine-dependent methyltransferase